MRIKIKKRHTVQDGRYLARVAEIDDYKSKSGAYSIRIKLIPFDSDGDYEPVYIFLTQECYDDAIGLQLFDIFGIELKETVTTNQMKKEFVGKEVCIEIEVNDLGTNKVYRNVIDLLSVEEIDEFYGIENQDEEESENELDVSIEDDEEELEEEEEEVDDDLPVWNEPTRNSGRRNSRR